MSRRHVAFLIAFGPEVRAFLYSGLIPRVAAKHLVSVITAHPGSGAFLSLERIPLIVMPEGGEANMLQRVRYWSEVLHEEWLRSRGRQRWRHYLPPPGRAGGGAGRFRPLARVLARIPGVPRLAHWAENRYALGAGTHWEWKRLYQQGRIDCLVTSSYASARTLPAIQTAINLGVRTVILPNSWKDVYAKPYVPATPDRIGVWSQSVASDLIAANPHMPKERIAVCGSLHLAALADHSAVMDRDEFCRKFGLDAARPIICYTAAAPAAVRNEERIVEALLEAIENGTIPHSPQLLLRLNPMEDGARFRGLGQRYRTLRVQKPLWEWSERQDWCCALPEDTELWRATVYHSAVNVSIASTVTLEFAALGRPVINICFDLPEDQPASSSNKRFWDAEFYREVREAGAAAPAFSFPELVARIAEALEGRLRQTRPPTLFPVPSPVQAAADLIESALAA